MNRITAENISKRYLKNTLFQNVSIQLQSADSLAITGYNGSGKSTLLKIISGFVTPTTGTVDFFVDDKKTGYENMFRYISYAAPYIDLIDDFTLLDNIAYYNKFKSFYENISSDELIEIAFLNGAETKPVKNFSSGMKQRLKLSLAFLSDVPFLFLDEPLSNLDSRGVAWYYGMIEKYVRNRIVIICTNNEKEEAAFCKMKISIEDFKK